jgi:transcription elongation GreA/GreB family factor
MPAFRPGSSLPREEPFLHAPAQHPHASVIDPFMNTSLIAFYDLVTLRPLNELGALHEPDLTIQLVPHHAADAAHGRVSVEAPLGRAILRRSEGEIVTIHVQDHSLSMRILNVARPSAPDLEPSSVGSSDAA